MSATIVIDFPRFDAHFWVEREGKIIDFYFEEYDYIKRVNFLLIEHYFKMKM